MAEDTIKLQEQMRLIKRIRKYNRLGIEQARQQTIPSAVFFEIQRLTEEAIQNLMDGKATTSDLDEQARYPIT